MVIHAELKHISVLERVRPALRVGPAQPDVVEEGSRRGFGVLDEELAGVVDPNLGVAARDDLGLEGDSSWVAVVVVVRAIGEATDSEDLEGLYVSVDGLEVEGAR